MPKPVIDYDKCKVHKVCMDVCPMDVFDYDESENKVTVARPDDCIGCRACEVQCPEQAIVIED